MNFMLTSLLLTLCSAALFAQDGTRRLSGTVVTANNEVVCGATVTVKTSTGDKTATTDGEGN